ncbi:unnamed protein product [Cuscuta epithymum]|uniref:F-box associated beta-propeller type 1 domain-containing protein n=1 Tax=Cuscuta epithymum TaxID=186058 RepID=A0AAV0FEL4_9ASTE|nr:unnamed protein product [Cuscuta epithymum]
MALLHQPHQAHPRRQTPPPRRVPKLPQINGEVDKPRPSPSIQWTSSLREPRLFPDRYLYYWPHILCSCNGLVLLRAAANFWLWNPLTGWRGVVLHHEHLKDRDLYVLAGMCYDASREDYKVVALFRHFSPDYGYGGRHSVFASVRNKTWRRVPFPFNLRTASDGVHFRNRPHWRVSDVKRPRCVGRA